MTNIKYYVLRTVVRRRPDSIYCIYGIALQAKSSSCIYCMYIHTERDDRRVDDR